METLTGAPPRDFGLLLPLFQGGGQPAPGGVDEPRPSRQIHGTDRGI